MSEPKRAQLVDIELEELKNNRCLVRVKMARRTEDDAERTAVGEAQGAMSDLGQLWCTAEATLDALRQLYGAAEDMFAVIDLKTVPSFDKEAAIIAVSARHGGETRRLVGFCEVRGDGREAVARAVCNGLNRFLTHAFPS